MKTHLMLFLIGGLMLPAKAQLKVGISADLGVNRMQMDDPEPLARGEMPLQLAFESELFLDYQLKSGLGLRLSGAIGRQNTNQVIGANGRGRVGGYLQQRSWAVGLVFSKEVSDLGKVRLEGFLQGGLRYTEDNSSECTGFSSSATFNEQDDFFTIAAEYLAQSTTPVVPELRTGVGISVPIFKPYPGVRAFVMTQLRYSLEEVHRLNARYAADTYPIAGNQDFDDLVDEARAMYPLCQGDLEELDWTFDGRYSNLLTGHLISFRMGLVVPINLKKE